MEDGLDSEHRAVEVDADTAEAQIIRRTETHQHPLMQIDNGRVIMPFLLAKHAFSRRSVHSDLQLM